MLKMWQNRAQARRHVPSMGEVMNMDEMIFDLSVTTYLDQLAGAASVPGGGSAAALGGATAAALVSMACNLTIGKARHADVEDEMRDLLDRAEALRHELQELAEADVAASKRLSASYELPRTTESDIAIRRDAIQSSLRRATEVPLRTARAAAAVLGLCLSVAERGNRDAVSDVGGAVLHAHATVRAALLHVESNLRALEDALYVRQVRAEVARLIDGLEAESARIVELVQSKINAR